MLLKWIPCFLVVLLGVAIIWTSTLAPSGGHGRDKRDHSGDNSNNSPLDWYTKAFNFSSSFELNMWYRYAQFLAKSKNQSNCYVCTRMPIATRNPHIIPKPVTNVSTLFPHILSSSLSATFLNQTYWFMISGPGPNVSKLDFTHFLNTNDTKNNSIYGPVHLTKDIQFDCFYNKNNPPNFAIVMLHCFTDNILILPYQQPHQLEKRKHKFSFFTDTMPI